MSDFNKKLANLNRKALAGAAVAGTVLLVVGIKVFVGNSAAPATRGDDQNSAFKFGGKAPAGRLYNDLAAASAPQGSSLDLFKKANKDVAAEMTGASGKTADPHGLRSRKNGAAVGAFSQSGEHEINRNSDPGYNNKAGKGPQGGAAQAGRLATAGGSSSRVRTLASGTGMPRLQTGPGKTSSFAGGASLGSGNRNNKPAFKKMSGFSKGGEDETEASGSQEGTDYGEGSGIQGGNSEEEEDTVAGASSAASSKRASSRGDKPSFEFSISPEFFNYKTLKIKRPFWLWHRRHHNKIIYPTARKKATITNNGNASMPLGRIKKLDASEPFYLEKDKCSSQTLAPGQSCTFTVRYSPKNQEEYGTDFEIPIKASDSFPYTLPAQGNAKFVWY